VSSSTQAVYSEMELEGHYSNSEGLDLESKTTRMGFMVSAVAHRNGLYQTDGEGRAGVGASSSLIGRPGSSGKGGRRDGSSASGCTGT